LPDRAADAVVSIDALQFAASVPVALEECRWILQPGGRVVITT
jgi:ubiquinone/menaquinone biosynthesis C-methylase UbiE